FGGSTLVGENPIPAGSQWTTTPTGWRLRRYPPVTPGGIGMVQFKLGGAGHSKISLKGNGSLLAPPSIPLTTPVTAQLISSGGDCFGATYATPATNSGSNFKAKGQ